MSQFTLPASINPSLLPTGDTARCPVCHATLTARMTRRGPAIQCHCDDEPYAGFDEWASEVEAREATEVDPFAARIAAGEMYRPNGWTHVAA